MTLDQIREFGKANPGVKLTHRYFSRGEFVVYTATGSIIDEEGFELREEEFWNIRKSVQAFNSDWTYTNSVLDFAIFEENDSIVEIEDPKVHINYGYPMIFIPSDGSSPRITRAIEKNDPSGKYYGIFLDSDK